MCIVSVGLRYMYIRYTMIKDRVLSMFNSISTSRLNHRSSSIVYITLDGYRDHFYLDYVLFYISFTRSHKFTTNVKC